jgi:hypothetical protein
MFSSFESFSEAYHSANFSNLLEAALGDLWAGLNNQDYRYQILRKSIKLLMISVILLTVTTVITIIVGTL